MARNTPLSTALISAEYIVEKYKFVLQHFPDCKIQKSYSEYVGSSPVFISKKINNSYTHLDFVNKYGCLNVIPYCKLDFSYKDKSETIIINSSPKRSRLAILSHKKDDITKVWFKVIKFSRLSFNLKNNNFDDKMLNECRTHIISFIKDNPGTKLDEKHLEPRLKKLLVFT